MSNETPESPKTVLPPPELLASMPTPKPNPSPSGVPWIIGLVVLGVIVVAGLGLLADGPTNSSIADGSSQASSALTSQAAQIGLTQPVINTATDQGCTIIGPTDIGSFTSTVLCTYYYHAFTIGSGNQKNDLQSLAAKVQAAGFEPDTPGASADSPQPTGIFHFGSAIQPEQLNTELITDQNDIEFAGEGDNSFSKLAEGKLPKDKYLFGYTISYRYIQSTCVVCLGFEVRAGLTSHMAPTTPVPSEAPSQTISFPVYLPSYMPSNTTFDRYNKPGNWLGIFYVLSGSRRSTGFVEFPTPSYYNPPSVCGDGEPDGELDPCQELFVTPAGRTVYLDTANQSSSVVYVRIKNTVVVFDTGIWLGSPQGGDDGLNGGSSIVTPGELAALPSSSMETQLAKIVDSLAPATPAQLKTIDSSPNLPNYGTPGGF